MACTDTGFTGRSISLTSRSFHDLSKHIKFRSVALLGVVQIIDFLNVIERIPYPQVENLFISTYNGSGFPEGVVPGTVESLINLYKPGFDIRLLFPSSVVRPSAFLLYSNDISSLILRKKSATTTES
jgi:uncharacterized membrane protein